MLVFLLRKHNLAFAEFVSGLFMIVHGQERPGTLCTIRAGLTRLLQRRQHAMAARWFWATSSCKDVRALRVMAVSD
jgi:ABC-type uncharacterized transport system involved in gliding motility auxiliary subunit